MAEAWLNEINTKKSKQNFGYSIENEKLFFNIKIESRTFYSFWLQMLPWILIIGVLFIAISIGNAGSHISSLGIRLSGQMVGTAITLLNSGFIIIYYLQIIEPRAERNNAESWNWKSFAELFVASLLFLLVIIICVLGEAIFGTARFSSGIVSLVVFLSINIITAFTIAFGIILNDTFNNLLRTEKYMLYIVRMIPVLANKIPLQLWYTETAKFTKNLIAIEEELMEMILIKAQWKPYKYNMQRYIEARMKNLKLPWFKSPKDIKNEHPLISIDTFERKYFPEITSQIESTQTSISLKNGEKASLLLDIKNIEEEKTPYIKELIEEIKSHDTEFKELLRQKTELEEKKFTEISTVNTIERRVETEIIKGYDLGCWWLNNK